MSKELIQNLQEYIDLLSDELSEAVPYAARQGWRSSRVYEGKELRKKIEEQKSDYLSPVSETHDKKEDLWNEVQKTMALTTYRTPLNKHDTAIYMVDVPKVIEILKSQYKIERCQ